MLGENIVFNGYGITDTGKRRSQNEDFFICDPEKAIFLVADGVGGESGGEVASRLAAEHFVRLITPFVLDSDATIPFNHPNNGDLFQSTLAHAVEGANAAVIDFAEEHKTHRGMGSTLTAAIFHEDRIYVAHIGDSRLYRVREDDMQQVTEDHTKVQEMVKENILAIEEARKHPQRHIITRCVGRKKQSKPDIFSIDYSTEDIFLLSSDGLHDMLRDEEIRLIVVHAETLEQAGKRLIEAANEKGGKDNITVVLFQPYSVSEQESPVR